MARHAAVVEHAAKAGVNRPVIVRVHAPVAVTVGIPSQRQDDEFARSGPVNEAAREAVSIFN